MFKSMFTRSRKVSLITAVLLLILALQIATGCGSSNKSTADYVSQKSTSQSEVARDQDGGMGTTPAIPNDVERKIIQNVDLRMQVDDVQSVMDKIIALTGQKGGYIVNSSIYKEEENHFRASLTVKIPREKLNEAVHSINELGEVVNHDTYTEDVTEEYYDSQARLTVLEAKETRLIALLDKAASITDIVSIENELAKVRSDIEVLKGRLQYLTNATSFSTININLTQAVPGQIKAPQGTTGKAWQGLINSINSLIDFGSNLIVFLVTLLPWLAVLAVIYFIVRAIRNKCKSKIDPQ